MATHALATKVEVSRGKKTVRELFDDTEGCVRAMRDSLDEALERHRLLGESIVVEQDGQIVEIPASEIEPLASKRARREAEGAAAPK
jgi:hypothetical protein